MSADLCSIRESSTLAVFSCAAEDYFVDSHDFYPAALLRRQGLRRILGGARIGYAGGGHYSDTLFLDCMENDEGTRIEKVILQHGRKPVKRGVVEKYYPPFGRKVLIEWPIIYYHGNIPVY